MDCLLHLPLPSLLLQVQSSILSLQVVKKVAEEKPPSLGKWSDKPQAADATHVVKRDVEYKLLSDPDEVIEPDQRVKAYQVCSCLTFCSSYRYILCIKIEQYFMLFFVWCTVLLQGMILRPAHSAVPQWAAGQADGPAWLPQPVHPSSWCVSTCSGMLLQQHVCIKLNGQHVGLGCLKGHSCIDLAARCTYLKFICILT